MPYLDALPDGSAGGRLARVRRIFAADRERREGFAAVVEAASGGFRDERLDAAGDRVLSQVEGLERAKARLEARLLQAYAALHTIQAQQLTLMAGATPVPLSTDRLVTAEIACATGVGRAEVSRRLELALATRRHRVLHAGLRQGTVSLYRALSVVAETRNLPDAALPALEEVVLAPAPDGTVASQRLFRSRLRRLVTAADARGSDERRCAAVRRRAVFGRLTEDGMGVITLTASAERVVGVLDRVDTPWREPRAPPATSGPWTSCAVTCSPTSPSSAPPPKAPPPPHRRRWCGSSSRSRSPPGCRTRRASCPGTAGSPPATPERS